MNYRDYKQFAPNTIWHVYNRGANKKDIFLDDEDRKFFLFRLKENIHPVNPLKIPIRDLDGNLQGGASLVAESHTPYIRKVLPADSFTLLSYCLMPNHFHLEIRQDGDIPISKLISKVGTSYGKYYNKKYSNVGGIFQDAFKAVLIGSDSYLLWLSAYIHNNPKTAGLVTNLKDYPWSSYLDYAGLREGTLCNKEILLSQFKNVEQYIKFVADAEEKIKTMKDIQSYLLDF